MSIARRIALALLCAVMLSACKSGDSSQSTSTSAEQTPPATTTNPKAESARLSAFFTGIYLRTLNRSPFIQGYLGIKKDNDKWDDLSEARALEDHELSKGDLASLRSDFDFDALDDQGKLSYRLFERRLEETIGDYEWRFHDYPINQMFGMHSQVPAFLMNFHDIDGVADAEAYIARIHGLETLFAQVEDNLRLRQERGIVPPKFVFPMVIDDCRNVLTGRPFDESRTDSAILADFRNKVTALERVPDEKKAELIARAEQALLESAKPAYESLIAALQAQEKVATTDDGAWKLPNGAAFYERALRNTTTTEMTADEIHALGLQEVARIHDEMRAILKQVGFEGTLQEFFQLVKTDKRFYFPNTEKGRQAYLAGATEVIEQMEAKLDQLFITKPKARITVKRVEPYREESAGAAFYNPPSLDGKRAAIYYVNLFDMNALPKYEMEALAFHEGIPGHHMQNAIAIEQDHLPMFRRFLGYTAFGEGWGLYAELLGKELGFYQDPYSDFGRLAMELWRACRLVIDTGIHHKKWTREQSIEYLTTNTPGSDRDVRKSVERYIVSPSQATAYKIGMIELLRLRAKAKQALGPQFDIREFHETVLTNGSVPLTILEELVDGWIASKRAASAPTPT